MHLECRSIRFPDHPEIITPKIRAALTSQRYEAREAAEVAKLVEQSDRILELGAGLGFISSICSQDSKTEAILSFEADRRLIPYIQEVHDLNGVTKAKVRHGVLSSNPDDKELTFYVHTNFWGSSLELKAGRFIATEQVQVFQFNEVCREFRPTFIVCDIEGGEAHLFDNANLTGVTRVLLEIHSSIMGNDGVRNLFDRMSEKGFCYDENHSCGRIILFSRSSL